jgi:hypothetical protein
MCTLCLSDMGELRDEWLREPRPLLPLVAIPRLADTATSAVANARSPAEFTAELEAAA